MPPRKVINEDKKRDKIKDKKKKGGKKPPKGGKVPGTFGF